MTPISSCKYRHHPQRVSETVKDDFLRKLGQKERSLGVYQSQLLEGISPFPFYLHGVPEKCETGSKRKLKMKTNVYHENRTSDPLLSNLAHKTTWYIDRERDILVA